MTSPLPSLLPFLPALPLTSVEAAHALFTELSAQAVQAGIPLGAPPPEPDTCCGRGCNGCVWEGWYAAANWWCEEAELKLHACG